MNVTNIDQEKQVAKEYMDYNGTIYKVLKYAEQYLHSLPSKIIRMSVKMVLTKFRKWPSCGGREGDRSESTEMLTGRGKVYFWARWWRGGYIVYLWCAIFISFRTY